MALGNVPDYSENLIKSCLLTQESSSNKNKNKHWFLAKTWIWKWWPMHITLKTEQ